MLTEDQVQSLNSPITTVELSLAVHSLAPWKAPGPDGFSLWFFQHYWDLVKLDFFAYMSSIFRGQASIAQCNTSLITLIPKCKMQKAPSDWRPISLCNTAYKILSKLLTLRVQSLLLDLLEAN